MSRQNEPPLSYGIVAHFLFLGVVMLEYRNSDMCNVIDEYVRDQRYKEVLRLRFCAGQTYEQISSMVSYSPQHVKHICKTYKDLLFSHL